MKRLYILLFWVWMSLICHAEKRLALVVGNSDYPRECYLENPVHDADDVSKRLEELNFTVIKIKDCNLRELNEGISDFAKKASDYDVAFFFYAGHGIQTKGENYLIPIDATLSTEADVKYYCTSLNYLLDKLDESECPMKIIVLDACRNNPFARSWHRGQANIGLAIVNPPKGTFITFSTAAGRTALDGDGRNSPYTKAFLESLNKPNLSLFDFFNEVGCSVLSMTSDEQDPWANHSTMGGRFVFNAVNNDHLIATNKQQHISHAQSTITHKDTKVEKISSSTIDISIGNITFRMKKIDGGTFTLRGNVDREMQVVSIDDFYLSDTEVTQELWVAIMGYNPSRFEGVNLPVEFVSWDECKLFLQRLSEITRLNFRFAHETEWEYAANGGKKSMHYQYSGSNNVDEVAWYMNNSDQHTHPVASKKANELELYDMSGNVGEWCVSLLDKGDCSFPTNRGGSWYEGKLRTRCDLDYSLGGRGKMTTVGLRIAASVL